ncbi:MAG: adenosylmethionine--8-amino-7-oxononanoate transaminase [Flavobacteriaceae bacterium]|nr:adenosylmethionine--8-amino-7-oxononanoate transaminase [Flavobacteriaceae bacterium]
MTLSERDSKHIWHPLTQHQLADAPLAIVKAQGALLWDEYGKEYIDGISSWYTAMYGHCNEAIVQAVHRQMQQLDQVVFTGFTHEPAVRLSERLIGILPDNQQKIFFNDNGSTAVEVALKMALQYHANREEKRAVILAFEEGFHGDTFGAMSVSGLSVYNGPFEDHFLEVVRIPVPQKGSDQALQRVKQAIETFPCAAFVYEPLVQGAAGMKFHDAAGLSAILEVCKAHGVLCIADEVMTGFGKTGSYFASDYLTTKPDMVCLSKALTAGMVPMGITSCTQAVFDAFLDSEVEKGFFHAHTYSANPLGCAAALAGIDLLLSGTMQANIRRISESHVNFSETIKGHSKVTSVRCLGVILAIDLALETDRYGEVRNRLFRFFMERGIFLRPLGNTVYVLPPFVITNAQLQRIYGTIKEAIEKF